MQALQPFLGMLMLFPHGLELSLNACTHGCEYCFATLQDPSRQPSLKAITNLLATYRDRDTYTARLLREGHPVCVSNRVDPFAGSNWRTMLPILETMAGMGIGVHFQTKGGKGIDEVLDFMPPSVWYITITTLDEETRRRIEPQAPSISSRLDLITKLVSAGHSVYVGLNPLVPEWCPEPEALVDAVAQAGAFGIWPDTLHLSNDLQRGLSATGRAAIGEDVITRASKRFAQDDEWALIERAAAHGESLGLAVGHPGWCGRSALQDPERGLDRRTLPTWQDIVNTCWDVAEDGDFVSFKWVWKQIGAGFPAGEQAIGSYLGSSSRQMFRTHQIPSKMTFRQLLSIAWQDPRPKFAPTRRPSFSFAVVEHDGELEPVFDSTDRLPLLTWNKWPNWDTDRVVPAPSAERVSAMPTMGRKAGVS